MKHVKNWGARAAFIAFGLMLVALPANVMADTLVAVPGTLGVNVPFTGGGTNATVTFEEFHDLTTSNYIFAYQIHNGATSPSQPVFTVNYTGTALMATSTSSAPNANFSAGGVAPSSSSAPSSPAQFLFLPTEIMHGQNSEVLEIISPYIDHAPQSASLLGASNSVVAPAAPVPVPGAMAMLLSALPLGAIGFVFNRRRFAS